MNTKQTIREYKRRLEQVRDSLSRMREERDAAVRRAKMYQRDSVMWCQKWQIYHHFLHAFLKAVDEEKIPLGGEHNYPASRVLVTDTET